MRRLAHHRHRKVPHFVGALLALILVMIVTHNDGAFMSSEVSFTDSSKSGLNIVPASCPSSPDYAGQCDNPQTPPPTWSQCSLIAVPWTAGPGAGVILKWLAPTANSEYPGSPYTPSFQSLWITNYGSIPSTGTGQITVNPSVTTKYVFTGQVRYGDWIAGTWGSFACDATLTIDGSLCGAAPPLTGDSGGYVVGAGISNRTISRNSVTFCVSNSGGNSYFAPANSAPELQSFKNAAPGLPGVTVQ